MLFQHFYILFRLDTGMYKKSMFVHVLLFSVVMVLTESVQAQVIRSIGFSPSEGYTNGPLEGQPINTSDFWLNGTQTALTTRFQVHNEKLIVTQNADDNQWVYLTFNVQQSLFTVTFDWQYVGALDGTVDFGFTLNDRDNFDLDGNPDITFNEAGVMIRMNTDPDLDVRNGDLNGGGSYTSLVPFNYQDGALISVRLEVDAEALSYDAYVTKNGEEVMLADDYLFRRITSETTNGINCIAIWSNGDTLDHQVIIDNITIFGIASVTEWTLY